MMTRNSTAFLLGLTIWSSLAVLGCDRSPAASNPAASKVAKIVFVGKEHACDCTRKAVDVGWAALQKALGTPAKVPVERLQSDTDGWKVEPYRKQKPMMALPAIYFVDGKDTVVELLQGEMSDAQITALLEK